MTKFLALIVCCLALVMAGCGDDEEETGGPTTEGQTGTGTAGGGGAGGGRAVKVSMKNIQFVPKAVTVAKGGTITWTNDDQVDHTVTKESGPGKDFDSGNVEQGGTYEQSFKKAGRIAYVCTIHPNQTGTITVK